MHSKRYQMVRIVMDSYIIVMNTNLTNELNF